MSQPRKTFDLVDGLLYAGIRAIFGDKTPPIEDVLIGKPAHVYPCPGCGSEYTTETRIAISGPRGVGTDDPRRAVVDLTRRDGRGEMTVYCLDCWRAVGCPSIIGAPGAPDIRFDADRIHTPRPIADVRHNWMVEPGTPPRLVPRRSAGGTR